MSDLTLLEEFERERWSAEHLALIRCSVWRMRSGIHL